MSFISKSVLKTWLTLAILTVLVIWGLETLIGRQGFLAGFLLCAGLSVVAVFYGARLILWTYSARPLEGADPYGLNAMIRRLCEKAGSPPPAVFLIPAPTPNAFVVGRNPVTCAIAVTEGLVVLMNKDELESVIAELLVKVANHDTLPLTVSATLASFIMYIANFLQWVVSFGRASKSGKPNIIGTFFGAFFAPFASVIVHVLTPKNIHLHSDELASEITQKPQALAQALWKMHNYASAQPLAATVATAHIFVINPLPNKGLNTLFNSHPKIEDRIQRLIGRTL